MTKMVSFYENLKLAVTRQKLVENAKYLDHKTVRETFYELPELEFKL